MIGVGLPYNYMCLNCEESILEKIKIDKRQKNQIIQTLVCPTCRAESFYCSNKECKYKFLESSDYGKGMCCYDCMNHWCSGCYDSFFGCDNDSDLDECSYENNVCKKCLPVYKGRIKKIQIDEK